MILIFCNKNIAFNFKEVIHYTICKTQLMKTLNPMTAFSLKISYDSLRFIDGIELNATQKEDMN